MNINCLILARKNSKRIINKNIISFRNKPLIYWTIKQSLKIRSFKKIILSSDSLKIKKISKKYKKKFYLIIGHHILVEQKSHQKK